MIDNFDKNNIGGGGELSGFDSADNVKEGAKETGGYTVTPDGGFYSRTARDIIQDSPARPAGSEASSGAPHHAADSNETANPKTDFSPGGNYGAYGGYGNTQNKPKPPYYSYPQPPVKKKKTGHSSVVVVVASLMAAIIGAASGIAAVKLTAAENAPADLSSSGTAGNNVNINIDEPVESVVEAVAIKVTPSVVGIRTTASVIRFFGGSSEATGEGSGVIYTSDGYIITNYHVIESALSSNNSKIEVFLGKDVNSDVYPATVVGYNISADLAVVKINAKGITPIELANDSELRVGQYVITVGNPGGLEFMDSVTYGVISGLNRVVSANSEVSLIQTDAAINPGNSGGALVNTKGQLIGINSSKIVSEEFEGMGFAIPVNKVKEVCDSIIARENDPEPYIGITVSEKYTAQVLEFYGYPAGAVVSSVAQGSPAAKAGIARGDIITEFKGVTIKEYTMLIGKVNECKPGETVSIKIYRNGRYYTTSITVGSNNAQ